MLQTNEELQSKCILLLPESDHFEQKYDFSKVRSEINRYSDFFCKVNIRDDLSEDSLNLKIPQTEFVNDEWDFFKMRIFALLFCSQNLVYDVVEMMKDESSSKGFDCYQHYNLYFYSYMGKLNFCIVRIIG